MKFLLKQILSFGVVGVVATAIDFALLFILTEFFHVPYLWSAAISFSISLVVNYLLSMRYVFEGRDDITKRREFITFVILSLIGLGLNELFMWLGTDLIGIPYMLTKVFATGAVMVYNFVSRKVLLEKKDAPTPENASTTPSVDEDAIE